MTRKTPEPPPKITTFYGTAKSTQDLSVSMLKRKSSREESKESIESPSQKPSDSKKRNTDGTEEQPPGAEVQEMEIDPGPQADKPSGEQNDSEDADPIIENSQTETSKGIPDEEDNPKDTVGLNEEEEGKGTGAKEDTPQVEEQESEGNKQEVPEQEEARKKPAVMVSPPRSSLRQSTFSFSERLQATKAPREIIPKWQTRRFAISFDIKKPDDRSKRTEYLATELNKLLTTIRQFNKVYVRKFAEHHLVHDKERKEWKQEFKKEQVTDIQAYTHGFYFFGALRGGNFRMLIQLVLPLQCNIDDLIMNVNGNKWACKNNRAFRDIQEQDLYDPKPCGWFFRSNYAMVASKELQKVLEARASQIGVQISFGLSFKMIPGSMAQGTVYDKEKAIKAVCITTNAEDQSTAWGLLHQWYNKASDNYPLSIPMKFIPSKDHPDIRNNSVALQNLSHLFDRQKIFLRDTATMECTQLADPTGLTHEGKTLRHVLKNVKAKVSGKKLNGGYLFHAVTSKASYSGEITYHITYHRCVEKEARNVIGGLAHFLETELKLDIDEFCFPHRVDNTHSWDPEKRCIKNSTTEYLAELVGDLPSEEQEEIDFDEEEEYSMDSKAHRESRRVLGLDDVETVTDMKTKKQKRLKKPKVPEKITEAQSVVSEMTGMTPYSSASQASKQRKDLRKQVIEKDKEVERYKAMIAQLQKQTLAAGNNTEDNVVNLENDEESSEEEDYDFQVKRRVTTYGGTVDLAGEEAEKNEEENVQESDQEETSREEDTRTRNDRRENNNRQEETPDIAKQRQTEPERQQDESEMEKTEGHLEALIGKPVEEGWNFDDVDPDIEEEVRIAKLPVVHKGKYTSMKKLASQMREHGYETIISSPDKDGIHTLYLKKKEKEKQGVRFSNRKTVQPYDKESGDFGEEDDISLEETGVDQEENSLSGEPQEDRQQDEESESSSDSSTSKPAQSDSSEGSGQSAAGQASDSTSDKSADSSELSSIEANTITREKEKKKKTLRTSSISKQNLKKAENANRIEVEEDDEDVPFNV